MKIAAITDDGKTISQHFGRAQYYVVCTVEAGQIVQREQRSKVGHNQFANEPHDHSRDEPIHIHDHGSHGHGFGPDADRKHARMIEAILDCEVVLVRGMGRGAYMAMEAANIKPIVTDIRDIDSAVQAYLSGDIIDHTEKLH